MRQPALIATPAPAPYSAPATVERIASELGNIQLKSRTRIPPATVLPMPQAKYMIHGGTRNAPHDDRHLRRKPLLKFRLDCIHDLGLDGKMVRLDGGQVRPHQS